ncbi:competence protein [Roseobacter sp. SK209-2-6]|uniref:ComEC/Rec2 family competence protein n=1 Tax=Roseobacter sp. SK209-2-6 TaxID=388739 RepID=UPI0000F3F7F5|nr:ComEC/Rec2 family competence protein [Roseobacter sp. SK209-2-6]EBA17987.1 competence protein [Roseobacter sp. SK209-2-6]
MLALQIIDQALQRQRGHLLPWVPICLALGIGLFFSSKSDPSQILAIGLGLLILPLVFLAKGDAVWRLLPLAVALILLGFCCSALRSYWVAAPVLEGRYYGPVEGRLVSIDRSGSDRLRLVLEEVFLPGVDRERTPERVRISIQADRWHLAPGVRLAATAHLMPPQGPVEPFGFDFRRHAWFLRLGAVGYSAAPIMVMKPTPANWMQSLRWRLSEGLRNRLPGEPGAVSAAITTGDRSAVSQRTLRLLRESNLAHLLAISGLHMGLLSGFVFSLFRFVFALWPAFALRYEAKKIAAACGLCAAVFYLFLSGGSVASQRAFVMVAVFFLAILLNRRALSLRSVAIAAILILVIRPESLLSAGFQMSFAATTALVVTFSWLREAPAFEMPPVLRPPVALLISSFVAGAATAPFGAAHFNLLSHYGLLANLLAVPVMGIVVIPATVLALCLLPLGLEWIALRFVEMGLSWILAVGEFVATLPNSQSSVQAANPYVLPVMSFGALFVFLWRGKARWLGGIPVGVALVVWAIDQRPLLLISPTGGLVGVLQEEGRSLSRSETQSFAASNWLRRDGDDATQFQAAQRAKGPAALPGIVRFNLQKGEIVHFQGKRATKEVQTCNAGDIFVSNTALKASGGCRVFTPDELSLHGSVQMGVDGKFLTARDVTGERIWSNWK